MRGAPRASAPPIPSPVSPNPHPGFPADDKTIRMWEYGIQAQAKYIAGGCRAGVRRGLLLGVQRTAVQKRHSAAG